VIAPLSQTAGFFVIAQDRLATDASGDLLTARVDIPAEHLEPGPRGARFHVVDYDTSTGTLEPQVQVSPDSPKRDPLKSRQPARLVRDPKVRAKNVYVIAARTLSIFEAALGRRLPWAFGGHQLYLIPRAFPEANAYYDPDNGAILFGYLPGGSDGEIQTALSHDVVAHETAHAVLDGMRPRYSEPALPDQDAFHEALGDIVALFSVFSLRAVVENLLERERTPKRNISAQRLTAKALGETALFALAEELGEAISGERGSALRRTAESPPPENWAKLDAFLEPHRRGEVVVASLMEAMLGIWVARLQPLLLSGEADRGRVAEEGAKAADHLLRMTIRGIDYMPPIELEFADVLEAILKADEVVSPEDEHDYRGAVRSAFARYGVIPSRIGLDLDLEVAQGLRPVPAYERMNYEALRSDPDELFRFVWDNAEAFAINRDFRVHVDALHPSVRVGPDGLVVPEVIADYVQTLELTAGELKSKAGWRSLPRGLPPSTPIKLLGGGVIVFDQFGRAKLQFSKPLDDWSRQRRRLEYLVSRNLGDRGGRFGFSYSLPKGQRFALLHRSDHRAEEDW